MNQQEHTEFENKVLAQFMSGKSVFGNKKYGKEVYPPPQNWSLTVQQLCIRLGDRIQLNLKTHSQRASP